MLEPGRVELCVRTIGKHHPLWKQLRRLRDPAARRQEGMFLVEGIRILEEAVRADLRVELLLVAEGLEELQPVRDLATRGTELIGASQESLDRLGPAVTSQGLLGVARIPRPTLSVGKRALLLDGVSDPGNLGTLIRCAWAAGASGVLLHGGADPYHPKVVRASAGGLFYVPIVEIEAGDLRELADEGLTLVAAVAHGGQDPYQAALPPRTLLLLGSEAHGVGQEIASLARIQVTIPLEPGCDSLNVAVTGALLLFEHRRQHGP
ncbi:MAG: RNA methyltransferase [Armatimonadetes bacterium]|nr:RNA methyltransferase [Armatimonadota bacterium]